MEDTESVKSQAESAGIPAFALLGRWFLGLAAEAGGRAVFLTTGLLRIFSPPFRLYRIIEQVYFIGARSVLLICLTGLFTGLVLGLQGYYSLSKVGSEGFLGTLVSLSLIRELGPVFTAIMVTGRAGSAMAAEIGIMRISEQIDALHTMDINPIRFLISPRLAGALISFPLLTAIFDLVGIFGGYLSGSVLLGVNAGVYFGRMETAVTLHEIMGGFHKSIAFSLVVATVCCFRGFTTHLRSGGFGARGVSNATTSAVVESSVLILVVDYVLTSFLL